jgi:hypothetical protein
MKLVYNLYIYCIFICVCPPVAMETVTMVPAAMFARYHGDPLIRVVNY